MLTQSGVSVFPEAGSPSLVDIGYGLARIPRFVGQVKEWYSVLNHAYVVRCLAGSNDQLAGAAMLHEAGETVMGDIPSTWKNGYSRADEEVICFRVFTAIGYPPTRYKDLRHDLKRLDLVALAAEALVLGHYEPDHPHFIEQQRDKLFEMAVEATRYRLALQIDPRDVSAVRKQAIQYASDVESLIATGFANAAVS